MNELFKIIFTPLLQGLTKYFRQTIVAVLIIAVIWLLTTQRQDSKDHNQDCREELKTAQRELTDIRRQLMQFALRSKAETERTAKNDSILRNETEKNIKQVMP